MTRKQALQIGIDMIELSIEIGAEGGILKELEVARDKLNRMMDKL